MPLFDGYIYIDVIRCIQAVQKQVNTYEIPNTVEAPSVDGTIWKYE